MNERLVSEKDIDEAEIGNNFDQAFYTTDDYYDYKKSKSLRYFFFVFIITILTEFFLRKYIDSLSYAIHSHVKSFPLFELYTYINGIYWAFIISLTDIYTIWLLIFIDGVGVIASTYLKLIYYEKACFTKENLDFGTPCNHAMSIYIVSYFGYVCYKKTKFFNRFIAFCILFLGQFFTYYGRFISGSSTLSQLLYGTLIGYLLCYLFFNVVYDDIWSTDNIKQFLEEGKYILLVSFIMVYVFSYLVILLVGVIFIEHNEYFYFHLTKFMILVGGLIGMIIDFKYVFSEDIGKYFLYYMHGREIWNNTHILNKILRIIGVLFFFSLVDTMKQNIVLNYIIKEKYVIALIQLNSMYLGTGIMLMFGFSLIFRFFGLTNETALQSISKNENSNTPLIEKSNLTKHS